MQTVYRYNWRQSVNLYPKYGGALFGFLSYFEWLVQSLMIFSLQEYCVNQSKAIKILQSLRENNPELASHLQVSQTCAILDPA
jgi:hypothetical protein